MKKYNLKRKGMAAAALTLAFGMFTPSVSFAAGTPVNVLSETESQMSSDKEVVYVNNYSAAKRDVNFNDNWSSIWEMDQVRKNRHLMILNGNM